MEWFLVGGNLGWVESFSVLESWMEIYNPQIRLYISGFSLLQKNIQSYLQQTTLRK